MVFKAISNKISVIYCGSQFYWWRKLEYPDQENATDLQQKSLAKMDLYIHVHVAVCIYKKQINPNQREKNPI
jgi:plasmid rolling circle replication initiator protein Rep